ncbi:hypothetical protein [Microcoleus sp. Pol12B4]
MTLNRFDFIGLHNRQPDHSGIIVCTKNRNVEMLAIASMMLLLVKKL